MKIAAFFLACGMIFAQAPTVIQGPDVVSTSRALINQNFLNLYGGSSIYSVVSYGADPAGSDSSVQVQAAIDAAHSAGRSLIIFPPGIFSFKNVVLGSNITTVCFNATLRLPSGYGLNDFLMANSVTGASTSNLNLGYGCIHDGLRASYSGGAGDGNNIAYLLNGSSNTVIHGEFIDWHTDAILLGCSGSGNDTPGDHIVIESDVIVKDSRRNNISIVCGTNVTLNNPLLSSAGSTVGQVGTAPKAGLDVEPNTSSNVVGNITGSIISHDNLGDGFDYLEQHSSRMNSGMKISCTCYNNADFAVRIGGSFPIGGVSISGTYYGNGASGPGWASVFMDANVSKSAMSGSFNESNAGTITASINGPNNSVGDGSYSGATYEFYIDAGCTGCQISTGSVLSHGSSGFNPAGIILVPGSSGTFTPNLLFGGSSAGMTYSVRSGNYYTIGHVVVVSIRIVLTSKGSSTGAATITGLPFQSFSSASGMVAFWSATSGVTYPPTFYIQAGGSGGFLEQSNGGTGSQGLIDTNFTSGSPGTEILLTISYGI